MPSFDVGRDPLQISLQGADTVTIKAVSGDTVYYGYTFPVTASANAGSLTAGQSATLSTEPLWVISASRSSITTTFAAAPQDIRIGSDGTVGGPGGTPLTATVVTDSRLPGGPPDYIIEYVSGAYEAFNTASHQVDFTGADVTAVVQSVITALGTGGGYIYFAGRAAITWGQNGSTIPTIPAAIGGFATTPTGWLRIGAAPGITAQLTSYCPQMFQPPSTSGGLYQTIQHVIFEDLTVDAGGFAAQTATDSQSLIFGLDRAGTLQGGTSARRIYFRRLKGFNGPTDPTGAVNRAWLRLVSYSAVGATDMVPIADPGPFAGGPITIRDIFMDDCEFYGANGPQVAGGGWLGGAKGTAGAYPAAYPAASPRWPGGYNPEYCDNIVARRCRHEMTDNGAPVEQGGKIIQRQMYLSAAINSSATTITSNELANWPVIVAGSIPLICVTAGTGTGTNVPRTETMTLTAHAAGSTSATVTRGGSPLAFAEGDFGLAPVFGNNFQFGSYNQGGYCRVEDCHGWGSGDVSFEMDGWTTFEMAGGTAVDAQGAGVITTNYNTPRYPTRQRYSYRGVAASRLKSNCGRGYTATMGVSTIALGQITYHDCHYYRNPSSGAASPSNPYHTAEFGSYGGNINLGAAGSTSGNSTLGIPLYNEGFYYYTDLLSGALALRDCSARVENVTAQQAYNATEFLVNVNGAGSRKLTVSNLSLYYGAAYVAASPVGIPQVTFMQLASADSTVGMNVDISGVHLNLQLTSWPSTSFCIGVNFDQAYEGASSAAISQVYGRCHGVEAVGTGHNATGGQLYGVVVQTTSAVNQGFGTLQFSEICPRTAYVANPFKSMAAGSAVNSNNIGVLPYGTWRKVTGTYSVVTADDTIAADTTSAGFTITLHSSVLTPPGRELTIYRLDTTANVLTIAASGSDTILTPGTGTGSITVTTHVKLRSNGGGSWAVVA